MTDSTQQRAVAADLYKDGLDLRKRADQMIAGAGYAPYTEEELRDGIWTMTDKEFQEALRAAKEHAWEEGLIDGVCNFGQMVAPPNPYAGKK